MLAIIGGSGLTQLSSLEVERRKVMRTPYGEPSGALTFGRIGACEVIFLARHGYGHTIPPHEVNYRANLWALREAVADTIVSVASARRIRNDISPGTLVLPHHVMDYAWGRACPYVEGPGQARKHLDFTGPYSGTLREALLGSANAVGERIMDGGV